MSSYIKRIKPKLKSFKPRIWHIYTAYAAAGFFFVYLLCGNILLSAAADTARLRNEKSALENALAKRNENLLSYDSNLNLIKQLRDQPVYIIGPSAEPAVIMHLLKQGEACGLARYNLSLISLEEYGRDYMTRSIRIEASGSYAACASFINQLETGRFRCRTEELILKAAPDGDLEMTILFSLIIDPQLETSVYLPDTGLALLPAPHAQRVYRDNPFSY